MALAKLLTGDSASATVPGTTVRVYGATPGDVYRIYSAINGGGSLVQSATVNGAGVATFTSTGLPLSAGSLRGYRAGVLITDQAWNGALRVGNVFDAHPELRGPAGILPLDVLGSSYYATSQGAGSRTGCVDTGTKIIAVWRKGPPDVGSTIQVCRIDKALLEATGDPAQAIDQGPYTLRASGLIVDGHEGFAIQRAPSGHLEFIAGGMSNDLVWKRSTNPDDVSAWGSESIIFSPTPWVSGGPFMIDSTGRRHMFLLNYAPGGFGGDLWYGTAASGSTSWTWTKVIATAASRWGLLLGDMDLYEDGSGIVKVGVTGGSYDNAASVDTQLYRWAFYMQLLVNASGAITAAQKANGTSVGSLPRTMSSTDGSLPGVDVVSTGYHYAGWCRPAFLGGVPHVLLDNDINLLPPGTTPGPQSVAHWDGSAWATHTIPELIFWGHTPYSNPLWDLSYTTWNWGIAVTADDDFVYVYALLGQPIHPLADTTNDGMRLVVWKSANGFATYTMDVLIDDSIPYLSYTELSEGAHRLAGRYGAGLGYPKVARENPNTLILSAVDEEQATVLLLTLPPTSPLLLDTDANWTQASTDITVTGAQAGIRSSVRATTHSENGGTIQVLGPDASRFELSLDGATWTSSVTIAAGSDVIYLSVTPQIGDTALTVQVGIPR